MLAFVVAVLILSTHGALSHFTSLAFVGFGPGKSSVPKSHPFADNVLAVANLTLDNGAYNLSIAATNFSTDDHYGYSCVFAFRSGAVPTYYIISGESPSPSILTVDVISGLMTSSAVLSDPSAVVIDMSWMEANQTLLALASPDGMAIDIVSISPKTGLFSIIHAGVPIFAAPRFCESGLSVSGASMLVFTADTNTTDPDDGDQVIITYDIKARSVVSIFSWYISNGSLNALLLVSSSTLLAIATDPDEGGTRPLELLNISQQSGTYSVLGSASPVSGSNGPLIPSLGALTINANATTVSTILLDDSLDAYYCATWNVGAPSRPAPLTFTPVNTADTAGGIWDLQDIDI